jgi:hypothetical protein
MELTARQIANFWRHVVITPSCWLWVGAHNTISRHGLFCVDYKMVGAHVVSWTIENGAPPAGLFVLHNCPDGDRGDCVNPDHLWLGTQKENVADAVRKGRHGRMMYRRQRDELTV